MVLCFPMMISFYLKIHIYLMVFSADRNLILCLLLPRLSRCGQFLSFTWQATYSILYKKKIMDLKLFVFAFMPRIYSHIRSLFVYWCYFILLVIMSISFFDFIWFLARRKQLKIIYCLKRPVMYLLSWSTDTIFNIINKELS